MRIVKPQALLIQTAPTQFGGQAQCGISIGVGFRLSDPRVLAHEATVWEAVKALPVQLALHEPALPKSYAEWLLIGHGEIGAHPPEIGRTVAWAAQASLGGIEKAVSCRAEVATTRIGEPRARLLIDHSQSARGPQGNAAPLQRMTRFGPRPSPRSAMGPLDMRWPERAQWAPKFAVNPQSMIADGTHMGWPERTDRRLFQLAAPDQWHTEPTWPTGTAYELLGFGPGGAGYAGSLPLLEPQLLVQRRDADAFESPALQLQTVWFLPDHDLGVLWWNGAVKLAYVLDDSLALCVAALHAHGQTRALEELSRRSQRRAAQSDEALMPPVAQGWTWELIEDSDSHPAARTAAPSYEALRSALARHHARLAMTQEKLASVVRTDKPAAIGLEEGRPEAIRGAWRQRLQSCPDRHLQDEVIHAEDLSNLDLQGWQLEHIRFEHCVLDHTSLKNCELKNVSFVHCSLRGVRMTDSRWSGGGMKRCASADGHWAGLTLERLTLESTALINLRVEGGTWCRLSWQNIALEGCVWLDLRSEHLSCHQVQARGALRWEGCVATGLSLVNSQWPGLEVIACRLERFSAVGSLLDDSRWLRSRMISANWTLGTQLRRSHWQDCEVDQGCLIEAQADELTADHCTFTQLNAQRLRAERSQWRHCLLDGAQLMHARLIDAKFARCSMREAMLYGGHLSGAQLQYCNLIQAGLAWTGAPFIDAGADARRGHDFGLPRP
ncbi:MAG TPA: pentapeptide repeat-containing protein [Burkholderiaceae bacterium]|jgi:uncharacterized protein YjbI with pentapeptide repeats